jgi:hypothetical protein
VVDVLYSAAGNTADDEYYKYGIIGWDFEVGANRCASNTTGNCTIGVGFQPNFATEGNLEALEFSSGNYGLLEVALAYALDTTPPVANIVPDGGASQTPIQATFEYGNEPSVIYYTLDGTAPTTSSQTWEAQGPRLPGQVFQFDQTTTIKWIAKDIKGNVSGVSSACFAVETVPPGTTVALSPAPVNDWYKNPTVTLTGTDSGGCGTAVGKTEYRLDGGSWTTYVAPFQVTGDGDHVLEYHSVDLAGNMEAIKSLSFKIDATPPVLAPSVSPNPVLLHGSATASPNATDNLSGVASASCGAADTNSVGAKTVTCTATDVAGNTASASAAYNVIYNFSGFSQPVDNPPTLNRV